MVEQDKIFEKIKLTVLEFCDLLCLRDTQLPEVIFGEQEGRHE